MAKVRQTGKKEVYRVADAKCLGCACFAPGEYQHRGATMSGSRNTGATSRLCLTQAYRGCPGIANIGYTAELARERRAAGWQVVH